MLHVLGFCYFRVELLTPFFFLTLIYCCVIQHLNEILGIFFFLKVLLIAWTHLCSSHLKSVKQLQIVFGTGIQGWAQGIFFTHMLDPSVYRHSDSCSIRVEPRRFLHGSMKKGKTMISVKDPTRIDTD